MSSSAEAPMKLKTFLFDFRKIFSLVSVQKRVAMVVGLFVLSFVDLLGLAMLVPFLALGTATANRSHKSLDSLFKPIFEKLGLTLNIETVLAIFAGLIVLKSAISIAFLTFSANSVMAIAQKVRLRLARNILFVRWPYLVHARVGSLTNLVSSEASALGEMFHSLANLLAMSFQMFVYLGLAFYISWPAALFASTLGLLMFSWFSVAMRLKARSSRQQAQSVNKIAASFSDILTGIRPMRGMGRVNRLVDVFTKDSRSLSKSLRLKLIGGDLSAEIFEPVAALAIAGWFYAVVSIWQLEFHSLFIVGLILIRVITVLLGMYRLFFRVIGDRERYATILNVIDETEAQREIHIGTKVPSLRSSIKISNLNFGYDEKLILNNLNLTIVSGSITAIAGPSGIGKSTLVDLLLGLQRPQRGTILVDGKCLFETISMQAWRAGIGYVPQEQFLFNDTIRSNVMLGDQNISDAEVVAALRVAQAWEFVETLPHGLATFVGERGSVLSGGQRQRICIARALVHRPSLLILDEATTALDPETERIVCHNIAALAKETEMTVLVISHQPAWMEIADQVWRLPQQTAGMRTIASPELATQQSSLP
jgi:ATP-binding cassette subfamily C protein